MIFHLKKEIEELIVALRNLEDYLNSNNNDIDYYKKLRHDIKIEYADCFILLLDSAARHPLNCESILKIIKEKLEINKNRK
jgi:hypothetical protein